MPSPEGRSAPGRKPRSSAIAALAAVTALLAAAAARAQEGAPEAPQGPPELRELQRRNAELEQRVERLERQLGAAQPEGEPEEPLPELGFEQDYGLVFQYGEATASFELFGDVGFAYQTIEPPGAAHSTFFLGDLSLFVNAQIGDHMRLLSETVVDSKPDDSFDIAQERLWGAWEFSDQLYVKLGTEHSRISRWNQLYHHGRYLETSISRPLLARFEGDEGILPLHATGVEIGGAVLAPAGRLEYWGAISNGRGTEPDDKQRTRDRNDSKRLDAGLAILPADVPDLRVGGSFTFDEIPADPNSADPERALSIRELIGAVHASYRVDRLALLGELVFIDHETRATGRGDTSHAGYLQVQYACEDWTPYARFDYRNMGEGDPFYASLDRDLDRWSQVLGVRYDLVQNVALKLELAVGRAETRAGSNVAEETVFDAAFQLSWSL